MFVPWDRQSLIGPSWFCWFNRPFGRMAFPGKAKKNRRAAAPFLRQGSPAKRARHATKARGPSLRGSELQLRHQEPTSTGLQPREKGTPVTTALQAAEKSERCHPACPDEGRAVCAGAGRSEGSAVCRRISKRVRRNWRVDGRDAERCRVKGSSSALGSRTICAPGSRVLDS